MSRKLNIHKHEHVVEGLCINCLLIWLDQTDHFCRSENEGGEYCNTGIDISTG